VRARVPALSGGQSKPWMASSGGFALRNVRVPLTLLRAPSAACVAHHVRHIALRSPLESAPRPHPSVFESLRFADSQKQKGPRLRSVLFAFVNGGEGGIRTPVTCYRKHAFQACGFSHSPTSPYFVIPSVGNVRE